MSSEKTAGDKPPPYYYTTKARALFGCKNFHKYVAVFVLLCYNHFNDYNRGGLNVKPIFCIDITTDKNNETLNGEEFITRTASKQMVEEYETKQESLEETVEKSQLPLWLTIVKYLCALFFIIVAGSCAKAGFDTALRNAPLLVFGGFVSGIAWIVLHVISKKKEKKVLKEENAEERAEEISEDLREIHAELGVPEDAVDIDVLIFNYKLKDGEIKPHTSALQSSPYINLELKIFATDDALHIADLESVYSFKKSEIKAITTVNKRISVPIWNKDEAPRSAAFKQYKMTVNNMGDVFFKPYHILEIERDGISFGLYFPCYELQTVEELTGLKADTQN